MVLGSIFPSPRIARMQSLRPPAVAGLFYPAERDLLAASIEGFMAHVAPVHAAVAHAVIAPHAGYVYSGPIAAHAYAALAPRRNAVRRVVVAGPAHRVYVSGIAVPSAQAFVTPMGSVPLDREAIARLRDLPGVEVNDRAHAQEHCIEVQLPFLQALLGEFELVPLVVGDASPAQMAQALEAVWEDAHTLVVVSSDLSHYLPWAHARARDAATADTILRLEATLDPEDACGAAPINGLLRVARSRGLRPRLLDVRNSGDTAGDRDRVVGYGAFEFVSGGAVA
jgi:AmmeMemoRadiSam system protein B